jgi:hypothetical protein
MNKHHPLVYFLFKKVFVLEMLKAMLAPTRICGIHCLNKIKQRYDYRIQYIMVTLPYKMVLKAAGHVI